jgi:hypothetical protein
MLGLQLCRNSEVKAVEKSILGCTGRKYAHV